MLYGYIEAPSYVRTSSYFTLNYLNQPLLHTVLCIIYFCMTSGDGAAVPGLTNVQNYLLVKQKINQRRKRMKILIFFFHPYFEVFLQKMLSYRVSVK